MSSTALLSATNVLETDAILTQMYAYHISGGLYCALANEFGKLVGLAFTFSLTFMLTVIDWSDVLKCNDATSCKSVERYVSEGLEQHADSNILRLYIQIALIAFLAQLWFSTQKLRIVIKMKYYYEELLGLSADEETCSWKDVMRAIRASQHRHDLLHIAHRTISDTEIISRIMRKDNYLIGLLQAGAISLSPPCCARRPPAAQSPLLAGYLNKWIEKTIYICFLDRLFLSNGKLDESLLNNPAAIVLHFRLLALLTAICSPWIALILAYLFVLENFQRFYKNKEHIAERGWTPLSTWTLREFNELPHVLARRIKLAYIPCELYVNGYHNKLLGIVAKSLSYICGSIVTLLVALSLVDEDILLYIHLGEHNLLWHVGAFSLLYAIFRAWTLDSRVRHYDAEKLMQQIAKYLHHLPVHWQQHCESNRVRQEFARHFTYKVCLFMRETISMLAAPMVLFFSLPASVPKMIDFVRKSTATSDDFGDSCLFAPMMFEHRSSFEVEEGMYAQLLAPKIEQSRIWFQHEYGDGVAARQTEEGKSELAFSSRKMG